VVPGGQNVRAQIEKLIGKLRRQAKAPGGIFGIDDDQFHFMRLTDMADVFTHNPASRAAEDVADKEDIHFWASS
jgi:hypothetical protein